jgi:preprotein translocase subunit SecG
MDKVLLVLHLMIAAALVGVVLLQRSEGGGLGMGSASGGFMTGRGTANLLTRTTAALAAIFFLTSIGLTLLAKNRTRTLSPLDLPAITAPATPGAPVPSKAAPPTPSAAPGAPAQPPVIDKAAPAAPASPAATPLPEKPKAPTPKQ